MNRRMTTVDGRTYFRELHHEPRIHCPPRSVFEIGAHSLKLHHFHAGSPHTLRFPYALGHEVYSGGRISESTAQEIADLVRRNAIHPSLAIGTSAVRDADNQQDFTQLLEGELDLGVHVLSSWEEASLLAVGYLAHSRRLPALVVDVGGGSLELVFLSKTRTIVWDSLPLGAIRLYHNGADNGNSASSSQLIEREFEKSAIVKANEVYVTGGTAKAIARTLKKLAFGKQDLEALKARVRRHGPPAGLKPERARVFLPGLVLMEKLLDVVRAEELDYVKISIGQVFLSVVGRPREKGATGMLP